MSARKKTTTKPDAPKAPADKKASAKKVAVMKAPAANPPEAKKAPAAKTAGKKTPAAKTASKSNLSAEERYQRIQFEAYLMAEKNGFAGDATEYWSKAEKIVENQFA